MRAGNSLWGDGGSEFGNWIKLPGEPWHGQRKRGQRIRGGGRFNQLVEIALEPGNPHLVELPGGLNIMHTGDQAYGDDFAVWIDEMHEQFRVDVLLPNCWTTDLPRLIRETRPQLVITGHENELSHSVDHREAYAKTYAHIADETTPVLVMAWGERYHFEGGQLQDVISSTKAMQDVQTHLRSFL